MHTGFKKHKNKGYSYPRGLSACPPPAEAWAGAQAGPPALRAGKPRGTRPCVGSSPACRQAGLGSGKVELSHSSRLTSPNKKTPRYSFAEAVYGVVRGVPKGETMTYGEVAARAGSPNAYRAVGNILSKNWDPKVPCHRVIRKNGGLGGYNRGLKLKKEILEMERKAK